MATVKHPLHSQRASGSISQTITFLHTRRGAVAKKYSKPSGLPTADQLTVRAATKTVMQHWPTIHARKRNTWIEPADERHLSPIALYMLHNYPRQATGQTIHDSYQGVDPPTLRDLILSRSSCLAHYPLNDAAGPFLDLKSGWNATTEGGIAFRQPSLQTADDDTCATFNGTTGKATLSPTGAPFNFNHDQPFSISAIIKPTLTSTPGQLYSIFTKWNWAAPIRGYRLWIQTVDANRNYTLHLDLWSNHSPQLRAAVHSTATIIRDAIHIYHATYDGSHLASGMKLYQDGLPLALTIDANTLGANPTTSTAQPTIAATPATYYFNGSIDELAIYNSVLSPADCAADYAATIAT